MEINVCFESREDFDNRIKGIEEKVYFKDILAKSVIDMYNNFVCEGDTLIITLEDCSGVNSHVLETLIDIFEYVEQNSDVNRLFVNNPTKNLYKGLKRKGIQNLFTGKFNKIREHNIKEVHDSFDKNIVGQEKAKHMICSKLVTQLIRPDFKPLVLMFYGKPGLGKTETAKFLAKALYKNGDIVREQMSMVGGEAGVKYFKSASHSENSFSKTLFNRNSNIILLDEFILAPDFFKTSFFQMFDEGYYSDQNFEVDVRNSIIICTSNMLSINEMHQNIDSALLSRFDGFVEFVDFNTEEKQEIVNSVLKKLLSKENMKTEYKKKIEIEKIQNKIDKAISSMSNARNIKRFVEDAVSDELLNIILK